MRPTSTLALLLLAAFNPVFGLHFYLDASEERCFFEELPADTMVEGHYRALEYSPDGNKYVINEKIGIQIDVHEVEHNHQVTKTMGPHEGKFSFTAHEPGDHSICISTNQTSSWFSSASSAHVRFYLDVTVGATKHDQDKDRKHATAVTDKLRDLTDKLRNIRREQQYQREREAQFRNLSESVNSRAMWYMFIQVIVLIGTCYWQLRHLRHFFADRKAR